MADPQSQWLIVQLKERRYHQDLKTAQAFQISEAFLQVVIPFKPDARLVWGRSEGGETLAKAVISQARRWEVLEPYKSPVKFRLVSTTEREKVLKDLHKNGEFQKIKKELEDKGHKMAEEKTQIILNESQEEFFIWLRWQKGGTGKGSPLMYEDGSLSGGAGGTDIAVIYDPIRRSFTFLIVPPSLVSFVECVGECLAEMAMHVGPEALAVGVSTYCAVSCL